MSQQHKLLNFEVLNRGVKELKGKKNTKTLENNLSLTQNRLLNK